MGFLFNLLLLGGGAAYSYRSLQAVNKVVKQIHVPKETALYKFRHGSPRFFLTGHENTLI